VDWKIGKSSGHCFNCNREFAANEGFYSALYDTGREFARRDFCEECWRRSAGVAAQAAGERPFSFWRTAAEETPKKRGIDLELVKEVFDRLEGDSDETRLKIRYFLSLILVRKHALRYIRTESDAEAEYMIVRVPKQQKEYKIRNPNLTPGGLADVKAELENLLDMDLGAPKNGARPEGAQEKERKTT
jgi:hypothetical protein